MMQCLRYFIALLWLSALPLGGVAAQGQTRAATRAAKPGSGDDKTLLVYPNPSTGIVHLSINGLEGRRVEVQILNVIGTVMYRETLTELNERFTKTLDLSRFANGLYYVKLESDNASQLSKLVIR
ncbi:T9SS type A sorting domain-containing protein [uncultured Hymenobacter sp.]|uniref:T9SS type A sorting domain-containing protein n=1 Tax=uncultured Hymenobacter sp. TaxID=170016 RepID=UPI0035CA7321